MFSYGLSFVALFALLASVAAFNMSPSRYMKSSSPSTTKLYEVLARCHLALANLNLMIFVTVGL